MTVKELHNRLEHEIKMGRENNEVKIITSNPSMGKRASSNLKYASSGFDWESGDFNLVAEHELIKVEKTNFTLLNNNSVELPKSLNNLNNPKNPE